MFTKQIAFRIDVCVGLNELRTAHPFMLAFAVHGILYVDLSNAFGIPFVPLLKYNQLFQAVFTYTKPR